MKNTEDMLTGINEEKRRQIKGESLNSFIASHSAQKQPLHPGKRKKNNLLSPSVEVSVEQAQEQHMHHHIGQQMDQSVALTHSQNNPIKGMNFEELKNALINGALKLKDGAGLVSESTLKKNWNCWMGEILINPYADNPANLFKKDDLLTIEDTPFKIQITKNFLTFTSTSHQAGIFNIHITDRKSVLIKTVFNGKDVSFDIKYNNEHYDLILGSDGLDGLARSNKYKGAQEIDEGLRQQLILLLLKNNPLELAFCAKNKLATTLSEAAAEQLLNNPSLFQQGLNPLQFDNGFVLVTPSPDTPAILHYMPDAKKKRVLFSPKLMEETQPVSLGNDIGEQLLEKLEESKKTQLNLIKQENPLFFKQNAIKLARFSEQQLDKIIRFDSPKYNHLEYLLAIYQIVDDHFKTEPVDDFFINTLENSLAQNGLQGRRAEIVELCQLLANTSLQENDLHLKEQLTLLELYSEYGQQGIEAYSMLKQHEAFALVNNSLFKSLHSHLPLIDNIDKIKNALDVINSFDESKKAWFIVLLEKHSTAVGFDDLPTLVESFSAFANRIKAYHLEFYPLPENAFSSVKNLPTALGNILSILRVNKEVDRVDQWECISELCLDGNAAVRALTESPTCDFIIPAMQVTPENYSIVQGYKGTNEVQSIAKNDSLVAIQTSFYRYLAHQPHKLPLSFYQTMEQTILKAFPLPYDQDPHILINIGMLYSLLASTTTGADNSLIHGIDNLAIENTKTAWELTVDSIVNVDYPIIARLKTTHQKIVHDIIHDLVSIKSNPNLYIINQIIKVQFNVFKSTSSLIMSMLSNKAPDCIKVRKEFAIKYGVSFYKSMDFYNELLTNNEDPVDFQLNFYQKAIYLTAGSDVKTVAEGENYTNFNVHKDFLTYGQVERERYKVGTEGLVSVLVMEGLNQNHPLRKYHNAFGALLALMSHFKIDQANVGAINKLRTHFLLVCDKQEKRLTEGLTLIQSMTTVDPQWTISTLEHFIETISKNPEIKPSSLVKQTFGEAYFPEDFFDLCDAIKLPDRTLQHIKTSFTVEQRPLLEKMLRIFGHNKVMSADDHLIILNKITLIYNRLNLKEADYLFQHLTNPSFYGTDFEIFNQTLELIPLQNNSNYLLYFAEKIAPSANELSTLKTNYFLKLANQLVTQYQLILSEKIILNTFSEKLVIADINNLDKVCSQITNFYNPLIALIEAYPQHKEKIVDYLPEFIQTYQDINNSLLNALSTSLVTLNNPDYLLSLLSNLQDADKPIDLTFLTTKNYVALENKALFWKIICQLSNNKRPLTSEAVTHFLTIFETNYDRLTRLYEKAPYPDLEQLPDLLADDFDSKLRIFNLNPHLKSEVNGFDLNKAQTYLATIKGVEFSQEELNEFDAAIKLADQLNVDDIDKQFKNNMRMELPQLVALSARLLYLSTLTECNTIQYLAVLGSLKSGEKITTELSTGEGKSRVNMLMAACQIKKGQTVDFVTKDMHLAERDYLLYQAFFDALDAKSQLIYGHSGPSDYKKGGINFSTVSDLAHFRGTADAKGVLSQVMEEEAKKRTIIIDESDYILYGLFTNQYNLSMADPVMAKFAFVYEEMIEFFYSIPEAKEWDQAYCDEQFIRHVKANDLNKALLLEQIPARQREIWQESALIALEMKLNDKFMVQSNCQKETVEGVKIVSEAKVLRNNRAEKGEFTNGVHQFLHARLNWLKNAQGNMTLNPHDKEIADYFVNHPDAQPFLVESEKNIYYSLTVKGVLNDYQHGCIYGSTATPGTLTLQKEADLFYKIAKTITYPPANASKRVNHPTYLVENKIDQMQRIIEEIKEAQKNNQPYLLICEDDNESALISANLTQNNIKKINRLSAATDKKTETNYIAKEAGLPGAVTITTAMHGRGTDISLADESKTKGLKVSVTFLPQTTEEQKQIFGRAARFGNEGEAGFLLSKEREKSRLNKTTFTDGFYFSADDYLDNQQAIRERQTQIERIIQFKLTDFMHAFQATFYSIVDKEKKSQDQWIKFYRDASRLGSELSQKLSADMTIEQINEQFAAHKDIISTKWDESFKTPLVISLIIEDHFKVFFNPVETKKLQVPVVERYHRAHDGRAVLYTRPFEKWRAVFRLERPVFADFRAWYNGRGILFPQLRAWWDSAMTTNQFIFGCEELSESTMQTLRLVLRISILTMGVFIGAGVATALVMTGVLAPLGVGIYGFLIYAGIGAAAGLITVGAPMLLKAVADSYFAKEDDVIEQPYEANLQGDSAERMRLLSRNPNTSPVNSLGDGNEDTATYTSIYNKSPSSKRETNDEQKQSNTNPFSNEI